MTTKNFKEIGDLIDERAPAITMTELTTRRGSRPKAGLVPLRTPGPGPGLKVAAVIGAAVMVAGVAAGAFVLHGSQVRPQALTAHKPHPAVGGHHHQAVGLTAAMVRHIARASDLALATNGHVLVRYSDVVGQDPDGSGTLDITFSHQNFNSISRQPGAKPYIERVVSGRIFGFGDPPPGQPLQWYLSTTQTNGGTAVPDPRRLLAALQPTAGFVDVGAEVIDGVQVEHLQATDLAGLSRKSCRSRPPTSR